MKIPALPSVDCALLHEQFKPMDSRRLFEAVESLAARFGYARACQLIVTSTDKDVHVFAGDHRILISQNPQPLEPDGFRTALTTPFTGMIFPGARDAVDRHRANTFLSIGKGVTSLPPEMLQSEFGQMLADRTAFTTSEEAQRAFGLCEDLTKLMSGHNPASAIHWCASDNLIPQAFFDQATAGGDATLLHIRPYITSSAGRMGDGLPIGVTANGSQWLLGKMVTFEEARVPISWMIEATYGFIRMCLVRGSLIPHMDTFSVEGQDWQVGVFHEKIEGFDSWEKVRLVVLNHPKYGIRSHAPVKRSFVYKDVEDMKQRAVAERQEVHAANDVPHTAAGYANTSGARKSADIAGLRSLAITSAANTQRVARSTSLDGGLINRFRSLITGSTG